MKKGDVIAILSDEAREAQVVQATALFKQRKTELEAKRRLIELNAVPQLELSSLEAQYKAAAAALAGAEAERDRGVITAPWSRRHHRADQPRSAARRCHSWARSSANGRSRSDAGGGRGVGAQAAGSSLARWPKCGWSTARRPGAKCVSSRQSASQTTRTYRVEVEIPNADFAIPDGITAEVSIPLAPMPATRIPRSALTFSSAGDLGVRIVNGESIVEFVTIAVLEDDQAFMWVGGMADGTRRDRTGPGLRARRPEGGSGAGRSADRATLSRIESQPMFKLIDYAISHSRLTIATADLPAAGAGFVSYRTIPKEAEPDVKVPIIYVQLTQRGISPEDSERLLLGRSRPS